MEFDEWEPAYEALLADFGYSRADDERARDELAELAVPFDPARIDLTGATVAVVGGGPSLPDEIERLRDVDAVVAASRGAAIAVAAGFDVDLMVTDLDKTPGTAVGLTRTGTPVAVAAHGDNRDALARWVPRMDRTRVLPTTQAAPVGPVIDVGGFTDGDRAAFIADHFGADRLVFPGWDLDDPGVGPEKRRKLEWAVRLLHWLERRRGERFALLDGRRDALELDWLG